MNLVLLSKRDLVFPADCLHEKQTRNPDTETFRMGSPEEGSCVLCSAGGYVGQGHPWILKQELSGFLINTKWMNFRIDNANHFIA